MIRDSDTRLQADADPAPLLKSSLAYVSDAIAGWERAYPRDPAIPRNLLNLERAYLHAGQEGHSLALTTEAWLERDYPASEAARQGAATWARYGTSETSER